MTDDDLTKAALAIAPCSPTQYSGLCRLCEGNGHLCDLDALKRFGEAEFQRGVESVGAEATKLERWRAEGSSLHPNPDGQWCQYHEACKATGAAWLRGRLDEREQLDTALARVTELEGLVYAPGHWRCPKCEFVCVATVLSATDGSAWANTKPQECSNGCGPMWMVTERERVRNLADHLGVVMDQRNAEERRAKAALARVAELEAEVAALLSREKRGR